ncbi:helix-turn-helix transcriptional regulator [Acetobacterium paludosum]|nr:helix-turn-helix transcriptional regulator [Acetobacterium paludosum]
MKINKTRLGLVMGEKSLNFIALAKISNVSRTTLSYINNGKSCKPEIAIKIAKALDVEVKDLIED